MKHYPDLSANESLPIEQRVKHLEREAAFVRDHISLERRLYIVLGLLFAISALLDIIRASK